MLPTRIPLTTFRSYGAMVFGLRRVYKYSAPSELRWSVGLDLSRASTEVIHSPQLSLSESVQRLQIRLNPGSACLQRHQAFAAVVLKGQFLASITFDQPVE